MIDQFKLVVELGLCLFCALIFIMGIWRGWILSVGLILAYSGDFFSIHWFSGLIYLFPWFANNNTNAMSVVNKTAYTFAGFDAAVLGFVFFTIGVGIFTVFKRRIRPFEYSGGYEKCAPKKNMASVYVATALFFLLIVHPFVKGIPSANAFFISAWPLLTASICLLIYQSLLKRNGFLLFFTTAIACASFPLVTVVCLGFMGYGLHSSMIILAFLLCFFKPRWKLVLIYFFAAYFGASAFMTYSANKMQIREVLWNKYATTAEKRNMLVGVAKDFSFFDFHNPVVLEIIDSRLNQNYLIGAAIEYLNQGNIRYANGGTIITALLKMIPRIIWASKPRAGGSGNLVQDYTGFTFAAGTSIGVGQVMEFYINFGSLGIILGYLVFGFILALFDYTALIYLNQGSWTKMLFWMAAGICFINVGGALGETFSSAAAAMLFVTFINKFILPGFAPRKKI